MPVVSHRDAARRLPTLEDVPVAHALGAWKSWLAGRGSGLVPIAGTFSPRGAHMPGYELTVIAAEVVEDLTTRRLARLHEHATPRPHS